MKLNLKFKKMKLPVNYDNLKPYQRKLVREEYVRIQNELCQHCGQPLTGPPLKRIHAKRLKLKLYPPNFFKHPVHLHHCHKTGMTIGAVHAHCNAVLWEYHGE